MAKKTRWRVFIYPAYRQAGDRYRFTLVPKKQLKRRCTKKIYILRW